jgi:RNA polymerase sigma-70 factor (ECF subfamily)
MADAMNPASSFDEIYRQNAQAVYRLCLRAVSRREIAEELTSEVFLALHQSWSTITPQELPAWLFTVAKRRAADFWRRHYLEERWASSCVEEPEWVDPEHSLADLMKGCAALTPLHRICLTLRFAQGMSRTEIAQYTQLSELQVKGNLQYALQLLRQHIQPDKLATKGGVRDGRHDAEVSA